MKNNIVLNLLVFAKKVEQGATQQELIIEASKLGFDKIEVRREYFKNLEQELPSIKKTAIDLDIEIFYSVPEGIFVKEKLNPNLKTHLEEAKRMGASHIKWNIGDYTSGLSLEKLKEFSNSSLIELNIENDQTESAGSISAILEFMKDVRKEEISIGFVYDLGNWRFVEENEIEAAKKLGDFVRFIHMKDITYLDGKPQTVGLGQGEINWQEALKTLPSGLPIAIEYPTFSDQEILEAKSTLQEM
ncbi:MAG: sugar phosphate isomerase/epimerase [Staphylococcus equorum]|uniref:sugar phosphate isomerase/epimerase family protein n=1 Tax=Tetragenococcus halophilus TaxID=51669 RepID=UPI002286ADFD|nr:TIM barrel protein [Tetragenococcus halophilus]MDN6572061.1 sugar phosphate isomerase/epimerase [Staphylococcus equorum]MDN6750660.1 sugar phosphate isomerase/epimerase [Staphylococcus equorum]